MKSDELAREVAELRAKLEAQSERITRIEAWNRAIFERLLNRESGTADHRVAATRPEAAGTGALPQTAPADRSHSGVVSSPPAPGILWETWIGAGLLNRIGAAALALGLAFLLKLAADRGWLGPWSRVECGLLIGAGLIAAGAAARRRRLGTYSHALTGAGFAALYGSFFAAYGVYHLIGFAGAFVALAAVTVGAIAQAVLLDAEIIALLGVVCGLLTPAVLQRSSAIAGFPTALFLYLWLLNGGVIAAAYFKEWKKLEVTAMILTQLFVLGWLSADFRVEYLPQTVIWTTLIYLLFLGMSIIGARSSSTRPYLDLLIALENPAAFCALLVIYLRQDSALPPCLLLLAGLYTYLSFSSRRRGLEQLAGAQLAVAAGWLTLAPGLAWGGDARIAAWAAEACVLMNIGCRTTSPALRRSAELVYLLCAATTAFAALQWASGVGALPGEHFSSELEIPALILIAALELGSVTADTFSPTATRPPRTTALWLESAAALSALILVTAEVAVRTSAQPAALSAWLSAGWSALAIGFLGVGMGAGRPTLRLAGMGVLGLVIAKVFLYDIWLIALPYRVLSLFTLSAVLWGASYLYSRFGDRIRRMILEGK